MRKFAVFAMALVLAGCVPKGGVESASSSGSEMLTYEVASWGKPTQYWQVGPDGKGEIRLYTDGKDFHSYTVERYHIDVTPEGYDGVRAELADFISGKVKEIPCKDMMTDAPYGSLKWSGGAKNGQIDFNYGCMDDQAMRIFEKFDNAGVALREMMVRDDKPFETTQVGEPRMQ